MKHLNQLSLKQMAQRFFVGNDGLGYSETHL